MFGKILIFVLRPILFLFHPYRMEGKERLTGVTGPVILCSNHLSNWDPVLLLLAQPRLIRFMAKEELFRFKPLGWALKRCFGAFPVARGKGDTGALETAEKLVKNGEVLGIFPEGTRSKSGGLQRFKSGTALIAFRTGATVVPCGIDRRSRLFHRVTLRVGEPLTSAEMHLDGETPELRYATRLMRERVQALSGQEDAQ